MNKVTQKHISVCAPPNIQRFAFLVNMQISDISCSAVLHASGRIRPFGTLRDPSGRDVSWPALRPWERSRELG